MAQKTLTAQGDAQIDTAQFKFGSASGLFDGTGDYLTTPDSDDWAFLTGDFTIDLWFRTGTLPVSPGSYYFVAQGADGDNRWGFFLNNNAGTYNLNFHQLASSVENISISKNSSGLSINTWYHFAVVRSGTNWYIFQDGVQQGTTGSDADSVVNTAGQLAVGSNAIDTANIINGWLDEVRISKGVARWTSNFTPPSAPYTYDTNNVLLLHCEGADASTTFVDSSADTGDTTTSTSSSTSTSTTSTSSSTSTTSTSTSSSTSTTTSTSTTSTSSSTSTSTTTSTSTSTTSTSSSTSTSTTTSTSSSTSTSTTTSTSTSTSTTTTWPYDFRVTDNEVIDFKVTLEEELSFKVTDGTK